MPLTDRAVNVLAAIDASSLGERPLCFVTHSMGGLLVKQMLRHAMGFASEYEQISGGGTNRLSRPAGRTLGSGQAWHRNSAVSPPLLAPNHQPDALQVAATLSTRPLTFAGPSVERQSDAPAATDVSTPVRGDKAPGQQETPMNLGAAVGPFFSAAASGH